jgi:hypothetical protein
MNEWRDRWMKWCFMTSLTILGLGGGARGASAATEQPCGETMGAAISSLFRQLSRGSTLICFGRKGTCIITMITRSFLHLQKISCHCVWRGGHCMGEHHHLTYIFFGEATPMAPWSRKKLGAPSPRVSHCFFYFWELACMRAHHHQDLGSSNITRSFPRCFFHWLQYRTSKTISNHGSFN